MRTVINTRRIHLAVTLAALSAAPIVALASETNDVGFAGPGQEFVVSTSGATALGAFTRANNGSPTTNPPQGTYTRSTLSMGQDTLRIGRTTYNRDSAAGQTLGIADLNNAQSYEPTVNNDRIVYQYLERGSVAGLNDLVNSNGLRIGNTPNPAIPVPTLNQPLWQNGNYNPPSVTNGGYTYTTPQTPIRIAWSDVRFQQGFSIPGGAAVTNQTLDAGYGLGRGAVGGANFQQLSSSSTVLGGLATATTYIRNEELAVVPFNLVASPGTGLARLTKEEGGFLQAAGRLPNGANFNATVRDSGSGTRNQGALNLGVDPSFAAGERDRVSLAATYNDIDPNGNAVSIVQGVSEANPTRSILTGSLSNDLNERRTSPTIRFGDKTGGSILREVVVSSRMGLGILSGGDSRASSGTAVTTNTAAPLRALAIDFDNGAGFNQATAFNITNGRYDLWSSTQAITVSGSIGAGGALIPTDANPTNSIYQDQDDQAAVGTGVGPGIARKFLSNITGSVATDTGAAETVRTPAEAILNAGFILPQIMATAKPYDGEADTLRNGGTGRSNATPAGGGLSEQALYNATVGNAASAVNTQTAWVDPSTQNGNLNSAVRYNLYAQSNTSSSSNANADVTITVSTRANLAGDMDNDGVRDLGDVEELALAYVNPSSYVATAAGTALSNTVFTTRAAGGLVTVPGATAADRAGVAGLVVLTDFNSNGNLPATAGAVTLTAVERSDVEFFLFGASVDTSAFNVAVDTTLNGAVKTLSAVENRRENGVRLGQLKKNLAIDTFNTQLNGYVGTVVNPSTGVNYTADEIGALKFEKRDVNNDGVANLTDAFVVDKFATKNYTSLVDTLAATIGSDGTAGGATQVPYNLIRAELDDNNIVTQSDQDVANTALTGTGTVSFTGNTVKTGTLNIVTGYTGGTVTIASSSTLTLSAGTFTAGGTLDVFSATSGGNKLAVVNNAAFVVTGVAAPSSVNGTGSLTVNTGGTFTTSALSQGAVVINGNAELLAGSTSPLQATSLTVGATGLLSTHDNDLIVNYTGLSPIADLVAAASAGRILADEIAAGGSTFLALGEASDLGLTEFNGVPVDGDTVIGKYTYAGDANFDGQVTADDYGVIDATFGNAVLGAALGDLNYDGVVDEDDYGNIDATFGAGVGSPLSPATDPIAIIPEPSVAALGLVGAGLLGLRRRR